MENKPLTPEVTDEKVTPDIIDDKPDQVKSDLRKFNKAEAKVNEAVKSLQGIIILDQAGVDSAMTKMKEAKSVENLIENKRKDLVKPYNDEVARINKYAKDLIAKIPPAIQTVKNKVLAWQKEEEKRLKDLRTSLRKEQLVNLGFTEAEDGHYQLDDIIYHPSFIADMPEQSWPAQIEDIKVKLEARKQQQVQQLEQQAEGADFFGDAEEKKEIAKKIETIISQPAATASFAIPSLGSGKKNGLTKRWVFEITDASQVPSAYLVVDEKKVREAVNAGTRSIPGIRIYQDESISLR